MPKITKTELGEMRALALYGEYFQMWAMLEDEVLNCIQKALGLEYGQRIAVFSHVQWRDRIDILRTLVSMLLLNPEKKIEYDKRLVKIATLAGTRNMAAHNLFFASEDGTLTFYQKKAKGKIETPTHKWNRKSVDDLTSRLFDEIKFLSILTSELRQMKSYSEMAALLMAPRPVNAFASLAGGLLSTLPAVHAAGEGPPATPENDPPNETDKK